VEFLDVSFAGIKNKTPDERPGPEKDNHIFF
jgi:hypothetical protein